MIHFLNSLILPALIAVSLPFIIQLFNRNKNKKIKFSAVRFLKSLENKKVKQLKLYQILLLIVRTLIILFIVLTFARPTVTGGSGPSSNTPSTAVIVLDDSYSMGGYASSKTYMERANALLPGILAAYGPDDKIYLVKISAPIAQKITATTPSQTLHFAPSHGIAQPQKAFEIADSLIDHFSNVINDLFIISDFRLPGNTTIAPFKNLVAANRYIFDVSGSNELLDLSIDSVATENQIFEQERPINFTVFIRNHSRKKTLETGINIFDGEKRVGRQTISVPAGQAAKKSIFFTPRQSGLLNLRFQIKEDDLPANNNYYYTLNIPQKIRVLFISTGGNPALSSALSVLGKNTLFEITKSNLLSAASYNFSRYPLIILRGGQPIPETLTLQINRYAQNGGRVLLIPGPEETAKSYRDLFLSLKIGQSVLAQVRLMDGAFITLDMAATPAFWGNIFLEKNKFNTPPEFYRYFKIRPGKNVLVKFSNGEGLFFNSGAFYFLASSPDRLSGNLPESPLFVPLLYRFFYIAAMGQQQRLRSMHSGEQLRFLRPGLSSEKRYQLLPPSQHRVSLLMARGSAAAYLNAGIATEPGFYFLLQNNTVVQSLAVNISNKEFQPPYVDKKTLGTALSDKSPIATTIQHAHMGSEFWFYLILIVLILVGLEMILVKKIEGTRF